MQRGSLQSNLCPRGTSNFKFRKSNRHVLTACTNNRSNSKPNAASVTFGERTTFWTRANSTRFSRNYCRNEYSSVPLYSQMHIADSKRCAAATQLTTKSTGFELVSFVCLSKSTAWFWELEERSSIEVFFKQNKLTRSYSLLSLGTFKHQ